MPTEDELSCQQVVELVTDYLENAMLPELRKRLDAHVAECPGCENYLEQMQQTIDMLHQIAQESVFPATKQALAVLYEWSMDPEDERLNPNGGAIALGHPLGCSGARILTTLLHEMGRRPDVELGLATMCIGVGQGIAMLVEKV